MITVLDICTGIGGFTAAHEMVGGFRTVAFSEIDPWCYGFLRWWKPDVPNLGDLKAIQECEIERLGPIDIVCGGIPCQPHSIAGKRQGFEDPRDLWPAARRIVGIVRPRWCLFENVDGFRAMALDRVCIDLESDGYDVGAYCVPACAVDAPHERMRVWIVAKIVADAQCYGWTGRGKNAGRQTGDATSGLTEDRSMGNAYSQRQLQPGRNNAKSWQRIGDAGAAGWANSAVFIGPDGKARRVPESAICGLADGAVAPDALLTSSYRGRAAELRAIGNAIVPAVAARFFYAIAQHEKTN